MKALLFTSIYPSLREPTRGPYNHNIFKAVAARCETRIISPQPWWNRVKTPRELLTLPREQQTGIDTYLPNFWSVPGAASLHAKAMYASLRPLAARLNREFPFEIILAAWAYPDAVAASWIARDYGCPLVVKTLGSDINSTAQNPALRGQIIEGLSYAQRVVTVSEALRERVIELGIDSKRVITQHNGVNGEKFILRDRAEVRTQLKLPLDRPMLCCVGRLGHEKGMDVLLNALSHLAQSGLRSLDLHLVGGGEQEEELRAQVRALKIDAQVHFHGMLPHDQVPLWISACDVLCLPSRREGCPNVVLEALASGRPVVASAVGGVPELITHGKNGLLAPSENPEALARNLQEALERTWNPQALRDSVEFLSWDAIGAMYHATLKTSLDEWQATRAIRPINSPVATKLTHES